MIYKLISSHLDIAVALALILTAVIVMMVHKMGFLPKKSLPFVAAGLAAMFGWSIFKASRRNHFLKKLQEVGEKERELDRKKKEADIADAELETELKKLARCKEEYKRGVLEIDEKEKRRRAEINNLKGEELDREFEKAMSRLRKLRLIEGNQK